MITSRHWMFKFAIAGFVLALAYFGAELAFYWAEQTRMDDLRRGKSADAGRWFIEEGVSRRFGGRAFIMASTNSTPDDDNHFYDLSLICYGPGEAGASLLILLYKVTITPHGLGAYPLAAGDRAKLVRTGGGSDQILALEFDAVSEALELHLNLDDPNAWKNMFAEPYSKDLPLMVRSEDGDVAFVDGSASEHRTRQQALDVCSSANPIG